MSLDKVDWSKLTPPDDDRGADHLTDARLPSTALQSTPGKTVDLSTLPGRSVIYIYPMTGRPDKPLPDGWDSIPGARGCTPQSCAFRDHMHELTALGVDHLFGLSTQNTVYQQEAVDRLHLPYQLLSDEKLQLQHALNLPTLIVEGNTLLKRLTLLIDNGSITHHFYPVFPPDQNVADVIQWISNNNGKSS